MRKFGKKLWTVIGFLMLMLGSFSPVSAMEQQEEMRIEQVNICMPDLKLYFYPGNTAVQPETITAALNGEKLTVTEMYSCDQEESGTDYYILTDISLSIGKDYFPGIRAGILEFQKEMRENDTLTLITFGDQVSLLADRVGKNEDLSGVVEQITSSDYNTHLFEALDRTGELAGREELAMHRRVALVITDGEDCSTHESTQKQALEGLLKAGIPVYAMGVEETAKGEKNTFLEALNDFARETNGALFVFDAEEAAGTFQQIYTMLNSASVLKLQAFTNRVVPIAQPLTLSVSGAGSEAIQVCPRYGQPDTEAPTAKIEQVSDKEYRIQFSESVSNAGQKENYEVMGPDGIVPVAAVSYNVEKKQTVMKFDSPLAEGEYTVTTQEIRDSSMEENALEESMTFTVAPLAETESETETEPIVPKREGIPLKYIFLGVGVGVLLLIVVLLVVFRKKKKTDEGEDIPLEDNKLTLEVKDEVGKQEIPVTVENAVTIGRSSTCTISLNDKLLSRQHFSIEKDNGNFYVTDLGTTNGTFVNGVKIEQRCKLKNGDVVQAGTLHITIKW